MAKQDPPSWHDPKNPTGSLHEPFLIVERFAHLAEQLRELERTKEREEGAPGKVFRHTDNYMCVNLQDREITLTSRQSEVIQLLHKAYKNGTPEVHQTFIKEKLNMGDSATVRGRFRSNPDAWKHLITQGKRKGTLRLNI